MSQPTPTAENRGAAVRTDQRPVLGDARTRFVRDHIGILTTLVDTVERGETFRAKELPGPLAKHLMELREHNIIRVEDWTGPAQRGSGSAIWSVDRTARRGIRYWEQRIATWPCGHAATGFQNPADVDGYRCPRDCCEETFSREVVVERFDG